VGENLAGAVSSKIKARSEKISDKDGEAES
jgi:hypothetical protein